MRSVYFNSASHSHGSRVIGRRGFTLVEVMVAIAIALALIVGISQIFAIAQQTTGAGTALSAINDVQRSIQTTLDQDMRSMVTNSQESPGLVIDSYALPAFRNKADAQLGPNPTDPTVFPAPYANAGSNQPFSQPYSINDRIHRTDRVCFFVRGSYTRQTGEAPNLSSPTKCGEAFIWLGHLALPNDSTVSNWSWRMPAAQGAGWFNPGATEDNVGNGTNDNNLYASSWVLGRCVQLLPTDPKWSNPQAARTDSGFVASSLTGTTQPLYLYPPGSGSGIYATCVDGTNTTAPLCASRYDVAYTPINYWYNLISNARTNGNVNWWQFLSGLQISGTSSISLDQRYFANPFPTRTANLSPADISNWISAAVAQTSPMFVRGCSQFIVEFAGDYCTQDTNGLYPTGTAVPGGGPDGQIDFVVDPNSGNHRIRWYGFPRDTAGPNGTLGPDGTVDPTQGDVVPVSTFLGSPTPLAFERSVPKIPSPGVPNPFPNPAGQNIPRCSDPYICAWGPDVPAVAMPKMLRITIGIDNPNGRLNTQQVFEYIFTLPS